MLFGGWCGVLFRYKECEMFLNPKPKKHEKSEVKNNC